MRAMKAAKRADMFEARDLEVAGAWARVPRIPAAQEPNDAVYPVEVSARWTRTERQAWCHRRAGEAAPGGSAAGGLIGRSMSTREQRHPAPIRLGQEFASGSPVRHPKAMSVGLYLRS